MTQIEEELSSRQVFIETKTYHCFATMKKKWMEKKKSTRKANKYVRSPSDFGGNRQISMLKWIKCIAVCPVHLLYI